MTVLSGFSWLMILLVISIICFILELRLVKNDAFLSLFITQSASDGLKNPEKRFEQRYHLLDGACRSISQREQYKKLCNHVLENHRLGLSWCSVPKTGSTFWKKVFYVLQNRTRGYKALSLSQIGFRQAHSAPTANLCRFSDMEHMARYMSEQKTLLIVRNPYSRLFSAYIDKFLLPDEWIGVGRHIVKYYRENATTLSKHCGHDVTFKEFINYVVHVGETGKGTEWHYDDHWLPISKVCQPCHIPYRYIGKQETFASDREFIFQQFGIEKYFNESFSWVASVSRTISQRIEVYWGQALRGGCVTKKQLMQRMWTAFQLQAYLPWKETLQVNLKNSPLPHTMRTFNNIVLNTFRKYENVSMKQQKVQGMTKAYTALSLSQMRKIQNIYDLDFKLFGYEKEPKELFSFFLPEI